MPNQQSNKPQIFIDGEAGTTGLQIRQRLLDLDTIDLASIDSEKRKDPAARRALMQEADLTVLCLPDAAARESAALASSLGSAAPKIIDASTAHRVDDDWVYGFAELAPDQTEKIAKANCVTNPGCYPTGAIALIRPLVDSGLMPSDHPITINAVSGYSGGGRQMIETYETPPAGTDAAGFKLYGLGLNHKHLPELQKYSHLTRKPLFIPSVGRFAQGMLVSIPLHLDLLPGSPAPEDLFSILRAHYAQMDHVKVVPTNCIVEDADVATALEAEALNGSDDLELRVYCDASRRQALLVARLDNLGKGAAGAAVQNIKLMLGLA